MYMVALLAPARAGLRAGAAPAHARPPITRTRSRNAIAIASTCPLVTSRRAPVQWNSPRGDYAFYFGWIGDMRTRCVSPSFEGLALQLNMRCSRERKLKSELCEPDIEPVALVNRQPPRSMPH